MLIMKDKPITKEQYERAQLNSGYIDKADVNEIFSQAELCGYGVYGAVACKRIDNNTGEESYIVDYTTSSTCD